MNINNVIHQIINIMVEYYQTYRTSFHIQYTQDLYDYMKSHILHKYFHPTYGSWSYDTFHSIDVYDMTFKTEEEFLSIPVKSIITPVQHRELTFYFSINYCSFDGEIFSRDWIMRTLDLYFY